MSSDRQVTRVRPADRHARPLRWRLAVGMLLLVGLATLISVDRLLRREYQQEAATQAIQTEAFVESFLRQRIALLHSLRSMHAAVPPETGRRRFEMLVQDIISDAPDLLAIYLIDTTGRTREDYRRPGSSPAPDSRNHYAVPPRASALNRARRTQSAALTASVALQDGRQGMVAYLPIVRDSIITGFIGGAFAYEPLFQDALRGQLSGSFPYRFSDSSGEVIAVSQGFPSDPSSIETRNVILPGGGSWLVEVAVPAFEPILPRLATWTLGLAFLSALALLMLREEARARRAAAHTAELEAVSQNLLDANLRLEERAQQIAEANQAKSRFLANVSHELRTPLNAIVGYNSLAMDGLYGELSSGLDTAHARIRAAAEHLLALVNDVLDLSKIEVGKMEIDVQRVELESVLDSVVTVVEPSADAKGLRLDVFIARGVPAVRTDPRHVRQILMNLASNAIKFTDSGSVSLMVQRDDTDPNYVALTVSDTGIGLAESDLDRIFEEFEQVRPSGRGDSIQRGTGLGLAIARKLARLLGGDVSVKSRTGAGSRFTLRLPLDHAPLSFSDEDQPSGEGPIVRGAADDDAGGEPALQDDEVATVALDAAPRQR